MPNSTEIENIRLVSYAVYAMPRERKTKVQVPVDTSTKDTKAPALNAQQEIVLVVEDEETIAETLALIVTDAGYEAVVAKDGRQALELAREKRPHLIITDLMMPFVSGAELIRAVRNDAATEGYIPPPILVVTAASRAWAEQTGADAVIIKPFDVTKIEAVIEHLLQSDSQQD